MVFRPDRTLAAVWTLTTSTKQPSNCTFRRAPVETAVVEAERFNIVLRKRRVNCDQVRRLPAKSKPGTSTPVVSSQGPFQYNYKQGNISFYRDRKTTRPKERQYTHRHLKGIKTATSWRVLSRGPVERFTTHGTLKIVRNDSSANHASGRTDDTGDFFFLSDFSVHSHSLFQTPRAHHGQSLHHILFYNGTGFLGSDKWWSASCSVRFRRQCLAQLWWTEMLQVAQWVRVSLGETASSCPV